MKFNNGKIKKAFTLAETLITLVILGVIAVVCIQNLQVFNFNQQSSDTKGDKEISVLGEVATQILANDSGLDDFLIISDDEGVFSIANIGQKDRMVKIIKKYLTINSVVEDMSKDDYFSKDLLSYKKASLGKLTNLYSDFLYLNDGTLMGFRFYGKCDATEQNANPPKIREKYSVSDICMSIFMDVNGTKYPNKLGADQFIIPIDTRGVKLSNDD